MNDKIENNTEENEQVNIPPVETYTEMEEEISKIAKENNWVINDTAIDTIVTSKSQNFGLDNWHLCPCDLQNPQRFCGSPLCAENIENDGICHCGLFKKE